eukprot:ANDGO_03325.mRNA.1 Uncharacterized protein C11orf70 homolog OS=Rattus norvegicus PE=2 SV=1
MTFTFSYLSDVSFPSLKTHQALLNKWDVLSQLEIVKFSFDSAFRNVDSSDFFSDFFSSDVARSHFRVLARRSEWTSLAVPAQAPAPVIPVQIPATHTSLAFFDRLTADNLVRDTGHICKCADRYLEHNITVSDRLREYLLLEAEGETEHAGLFSDAEKKEPLFQIFKTLVVGGGLCQYEDTLQPYLDVTRDLYKDFVSVHKNPHTNKPEILSICFAPDLQNGDAAAALFPVPDVPGGNLCVFSVDPLRRTVTAMYCAYLEPF